MLTLHVYEESMSPMEGSRWENKPRARNPKQNATDFPAQGLGHGFWAPGDHGVLANVREGWRDKGQGLNGGRGPGAAPSSQAKPGSEGRVGAEVFPADSGLWVWGPSCPLTCESPHKLSPCAHSHCESTDPLGSVSQPWPPWATGPDTPGTACSSWRLACLSAQPGAGRACRAQWVPGTRGFQHETGRVPSLREEPVTAVGDSRQGTQEGSDPCLSRCCSRRPMCGASSRFCPGVGDFQP